MAKNTSIALGDHYNNFVAEQVESGRFGSASEVVRAGLRLLENNEVKLKTLRALLIEGEESGQSGYDLNTFVAELDTPYNQ